MNDIVAYIIYVFLFKGILARVDSVSSFHVTFFIFIIKSGINAPYFTGLKLSDHLVSK